MREFVEYCDNINPCMYQCHNDIILLVKDIRNIVNGWNWKYIGCHNNIYVTINAQLNGRYMVCIYNRWTVSYLFVTGYDIKLLNLSC